MPEPIQDRYWQLLFINNRLASICQIPFDNIIIQIKAIDEHNQKTIIHPYKKLNMCVYSQHFDQINY